MKIFLSILTFLCLSYSLFASVPSLEDRLKEHIKFNPDGKNIIGRIVIDDKTNGINESTWIYVKAALDHYKDIKPDFIILELNTPGGEVFAAQKISDALKELDIQYNIPVVAFINNWAISAGAMLAYSCRFITLVKDASMGAASPVIASETGEMKEASEKVNSALRADFANRAHFFDRNPLIAEGMVDKDLILIRRNGEIIKLDNENQIRQDQDSIIKAKGKLLTLNAEEIMQYGVGDILLSPFKMEVITPPEKQKGEWPASKMALFHQPFFDQIPNATIDSFQMDWKTAFFALLAHPVISSLLFLGMMLGLYLEFSTPGVTLPGTIAAVCLFLIILSSFAQEIGGILELIFLIVGLIIILIELFILPTFGVLGFIGLALFLGGLFGLMIPGIGSVSFDINTQTLNAAGELVVERLGWLSGTLIVGCIIIAFLARYVVPSFAGWSRLVSTHDQEGYFASKYDTTAIGKKGIVISDLKPGGYIEIEGKQHQAISQSGYIIKGKEVIVIDGQEESLIVKQVKKVHHE